MNNPLGIVVHELPGPLPTGAIVPAAELARRREHAAARETLLAAAHAEADALRDAGATALEQAREAAEQVLAAAREQADALAQQAKAQAVEETVQWLCAEHRLAQRLAAELAHRWRGLTAQVLEEVLGQRDPNERVLRHVERRVAELLPQGRLTLAVAPEALGQATQAWAATPALSVVADAELAPGQARLENARLRLHLDAPAHQAALLAQFARAPDTSVPGADAQADAEADLQADMPADADADAELDTQADMHADMQVDMQVDTQVDTQADAPYAFARDGEPGGDLDPELGLEPDRDLDLGLGLGLDRDFDPDLGLDVDRDLGLGFDRDLDAMLDARRDAASALTPTFTPTSNALADPGRREAAPPCPPTWLTDFADEPWEMAHD
ncbi:hypothetical protein [Pandoraea oxalativorans]|uniref:Flagellar assembly protein FliH/Type III secretion system HrpE domain-containing protein n=1 Tax=Pandoraea oxalativorans TaxID=573737 RepID=A0A192B0X1_9BURK|nr:hypothetical protein [Pandoraea oxalativorans]ANJ86768.1 hypothetical protein MB84_31425 [Pandoraea oxalativorans]